MEELGTAVDELLLVVTVSVEGVEADEVGELEAEDVVETAKLMVDAVALVERVEGEKLSDVDEEGRLDEDEEVFEVEDLLNDEELAELVETEEPLEEEVIVKLEVLEDVELSVLVHSF